MDIWLIVLFVVIALVVVMFQITSRRGKRDIPDRTDRIGQQLQKLGIDASVIEKSDDSSYYLPKLHTPIERHHSYIVRTVYDVTQANIDYVLHVLITSGRYFPRTDDHYEFLVTGSLRESGASTSFSTNETPFGNIRDTYKNIFVQKAVRLTTIRKYVLFGHIVDIAWKGDRASVSELNTDRELKTALLQSLERCDNLRDLYLFYSNRWGCATIRTPAFALNAEEWEIITSLAAYIKSSWLGDQLNTMID